MQFTLLLWRLKWTNHASHLLFILARCSFGHIVILEVVALPPGTHEVVPMPLPVSQLFILHLAGSIFFYIWLEQTIYGFFINNLFMVYKPSLDYLFFCK
jgi:hypothetical protein